MRIRTPTLFTENASHWHWSMQGHLILSCACAFHFGVCMPILGCARVFYSDPYWVLAWIPLKETTYHQVQVLDSTWHHRWRQVEFKALLETHRCAMKGQSIYAQQDHLADSDLEKATTLNQQFCQNFSSEDTESIPFFKRRYTRMPDIQVTEGGVLKLLAGLKPSKAAGPDGLHPTVLKEVAPVIAPTLAHILQKSLDSSSVPEDSRIANVCPLFKKGNRSIATNCRPISLTSFVCKTLEHIVCSNIMAHIDANKILSDCQHAFRKSHSCTTQLCHVINDWASNIDSGLQTDAFMIDFAKAFGKVPHGRLKAKLFSYGISWRTLLWLDSFLCQRKQRSGCQWVWLRLDVC